MGVTIRPFAEADLPAFAAIFRGIVDEGETYAYPEGLTDDEVSALWVDTPPGITVVAVDDTTGELLGSAKAGPNRPGRGSHVGTASFMVAPATQGRGIGRQLGQWVIDWSVAQGFSAMQFNAVVETNEYAVRLWKSLGFGIIGTVPEAFDSREHGRVGLHVMHRWL